MMIRHFVKQRIKPLSLVLAALLFAPSLSFSEARFTPENHINLGLGFYINSGIFEGQDDIIWPWPIIDIYVNGLYIKENQVGYQAGYEMIREGNVALFFAAQYNLTHLDVSSINDDTAATFYGIDDRDMATEIGFVGHYHSQIGLVEGHYFKGINAHETTLGFLKYSREISETGDLSIVPGLFVNYASDEYNRYYYSVTQAENAEGAAIAGRPLAQFNQFRPVYNSNIGNTAHVGVDIDVTYRFSKDLSFWTNFSVEDLTGEVEMSPLVEEKGFYRLKAGLYYNF